MENDLSKRYRGYILVYICIGLVLLVIPSAALFSLYLSELLAINTNLSVLEQENGYIYLLLFLLFFSFAIVVSSYIMIFILLIFNLFSKKITYKEFLEAVKLEKYPSLWIRKGWGD